MSLRRVAILGWAPITLAALRVKMAWRRNHLYVKSEKLWALLSLGDAKKILCSGKPELIDEIKSGFRRSPH